MRHGRYRLVVLFTSLVALLGPSYITLAQTPISADPAGILKQVQAKYEAMKSYSDSGQVISEIDMSGVNLSGMPKMNPEVQKKIQASPELKKNKKQPRPFPSNWPDPIFI